MCRTVGGRGRGHLAVEDELVQRPHRRWPRPRRDHGPRAGAGPRPFAARLRRAPPGPAEAQPPRRPARAATNEAGPAHHGTAESAGGQRRAMGRRRARLRGWTSTNCGTDPEGDPPGRYTDAHMRPDGRAGVEVPSVEAGWAGRTCRRCTTLVLVRHGQSEWNELNLFTGWHDVDLTARARPRPGAAGELLPSTNRPRRRAHVAAEAGHPHRQLALETLGRLLDPGPAPLAPQRAPLRRPPGAEQGRDRRRVRRRPGEGVAPVLRHPAPPPRPDDPVTPASTRATPTSARLLPAPSASRTSWPGCCPTGTTTSAPTCWGRRGHGGRPRQQPARPGRVSTGSPTTTSPTSTFHRHPARLRARRAPPAAPSAYLDPEAAATGTAAVASSLGPTSRPDRRRCRSPSAC